MKLDPKGRIAEAKTFAQQELNLDRDQVCAQLMTENSNISKYRDSSISI